MEILKLDCKSFDEVSLFDIINNYKKGVYIIWDSRSKKRPTYIGEGDLMNRLCNHRNMKDEGFAKPIDGYIINIDRVENKTNATINYRKYGDLMSEKELKQNTELVEFIMLYLANQNGLTTTKNVSPGKFKALEKKFLKNNRTLKIYMSGYNPFVNMNFKKIKELKKSVLIEIKAIKGELALVGNDYKNLFKIKY